MRTKIAMILGVPAALLLGGCMIGEKTHTLYLEPDGAVLWSVLETHMRSDEGDRDEESQYIDAVWGQYHPVAQAFTLLAPIEMVTTVLRSERPFAVLTEARFQADDMGREILRRLRCPGDAWLEEDGPLRRFVLVAYPDEAEETAEEDDVLFALAAEAEEYRILLTRGRFVDARGFDIEERGDLAIAREAEPNEDGSVTYSLTWSLEEN